MSENLSVEPFVLVTLRELANIIGAHYSGPEITRFFQRAGFPEFRHDGSTKRLFIFETLRTIQSSEHGSAKIIAIIEEFCNPKAMVDDDIVDSIRSILAPYNGPRKLDREIR